MSKPFDLLSSRTFAVRAKSFLRSIVPAAFAAHAASCSIAEPGRAAERQKTCGELMMHAPSYEHDKKCIAMAGPLAASRDGGLVLRMDDGTRKVFKGGSEAGYGYALLDFNPATHQFVVGDLGDDSGDLSVIDGRSGRKIEIGNAYPSLSPDGRFILVEAGDPNDGVPTTFSILDATTSPKARRLWRATAGKGSLVAGAKFGAWETNDIVRLDAKDHAPRFVTRAADGTWQLGKERPIAAPPIAAGH